MLYKYAPFTPTTREQIVPLSSALESAVSNSDYLASVAVRSCRRSSVSLPKGRSVGLPELSGDKFHPPNLFAVISCAIIYRTFR